MWSKNLLRLFCAGVVLAAFVSSAALAQQELPAAGTGRPVEEGQEPAEGQQEDTGGVVAAPEAVPEGIELVEGSGFRYDSRGRRDPFVSLALGVNVLSPDVRPPGLSGMLIQEVNLDGIVKTVDGFIAMIEGTDNKSYFAREGERLYDGIIETIEDGRVVFRQEINDPLRIEKFHRVEKRLHPVEEGR
jgi:hypothetical protein